MDMQAKSMSAPAPLRVGRLETAADVKREAGRLYRAARRAEVSAADASRLATVLALIVRVIEGAELETRLTALEAKAGGRS